MPAWLTPARPFTTCTSASDSIAALQRWLTRPWYNVTPKSLTLICVRTTRSPRRDWSFFVVHRAADAEHSAHAAETLSHMAATERDQRLVSEVVSYTVKFKLRKFDGIYDHYCRN